jgi:hypothetical protein
MKRGESFGRVAAEIFSPKQSKCCQTRSKRWILRVGLTSSTFQLANVCLRSVLAKPEPEARKRLASGEPSEARQPAVGCPKGERSEATSRSDREPPEPGRPTTPDTGCAPAGAREACECPRRCCPPDPACPSRALPGRGSCFVGVVRWLHHRLISLVPPARVPNSRLPSFDRSETILHGFDASLVALPSRVQHEKPGTLALADASATRSLHPSAASSETWTAWRMRWVERAITSTSPRVCGRRIASRM